MDPDTSDAFTFEVQSGLDGDKFSIGGTDSDELVLTDGILDYEVQDMYFVVVRVTDLGGNQYDELITVSVDDINEAPTAITPNSFSIDENTDTTAVFRWELWGRRTMMMGRRLPIPSKVASTNSVSRSVAPVQMS